ALAPPPITIFASTTLFRSLGGAGGALAVLLSRRRLRRVLTQITVHGESRRAGRRRGGGLLCRTARARRRPARRLSPCTVICVSTDRKSTRLNSSHVAKWYA